MTNNPSFPGKKSRGVHTSAEHLELSSTLTESDENDAFVYKPPSIATSRDADQSQLAVRSEQSDTDTNPVLYEMKTLSRKGQKDSPFKVEFREINRAMHRRSVMVHSRSKANNSNHHDIAQTIVNIPSQQATEAIESYQSSEQFRQPRSFHSKFRNLFSCLRKSRHQRNKRDEENIEHLSDDEDNAEFYYFDHGSASFYRTTDCPPHLIADIIAHRTTDIATKFWAEFFASLNIGVTFIITFIMQFYRFILYSIFRAVIVGFLQTTSDYLLKPVLAMIFSGMLQPLFLFALNIFQSINNMVDPLTQILVNIVKPFADCLRAFRLVDVKK